MSLTIATTQDSTPIDDSELKEAANNWAGLTDRERKELREKIKEETSKKDSV